MKRSVVWGLLVLLVLGVAGSLWFLDNFEQVPTSRWEAAAPEAQRNPYLAFERLGTQLGRPVTRIASPQSLDSLAPGGVLILDQHRRQNINGARADRILDWVAQGGYLIVAAEPVADDPLLARLGASRYRAKASLQCKPDEAAAPDADTPAKPVPPRGNPLLEVRLPDDATTFRIDRSGYGNLLSSAQPLPAWRAGPDEERSVVLHYAWGRGQATVVSSLSMLSNRHLGQHDHAELIWALLQRYQPQGELRLVSRMEMPTLWEWLLESAWMASISAALLIALWLWRIVPRFGDTMPTPSLDRRNLSQHLAAVGRCVWREGGINHWLDVVRQAIQQRLALRHPYLSRQDAAWRRKTLAGIAYCRPQEIEQALEARRERNPDRFTEAIRILQRLDQRL